MKTRFAHPILRGCIVVELTFVGIWRFVGVEAFECAVIAQVYLVVVINRNSTRADSLVSEASVMKIG